MKHNRYCCRNGARARVVEAKSGPRKTSKKLQKNSDSPSTIPTQIFININTLQFIDRSEEKEEEAFRRSCSRAHRCDKGSLVNSLGFHDHQHVSIFHWSVSESASQKLKMSFNGNERDPCAFVPNYKPNWWLVCWSLRGQLLEVFTLLKPVSH
jgi:hypothetical protein